MSKKKFQIMDQSIAMQRNWAQRIDMEKAHLEFESSWQLLQVFSAASPTVIFRCKFLWRLYLQIQAQAWPYSEVCPPIISISHTAQHSHRLGGVLFQVSIAPFDILQSWALMAFLPLAVIVPTPPPMFKSHHPRRGMWGGVWGLGVERWTSWWL
jgi:hypothetical protein